MMKRRSQQDGSGRPFGYPVASTTVSLTAHQAGAFGSDDHPWGSYDELLQSFRASELRLSAFLEDRARLARDLHDIVLQSLYALGLGIETARRCQAEDAGDRNAHDDRTVEQLNRLIGDVRTLIRGLESGVVQEFDFVSELRAMIDVYEQVSALKIGLELRTELVDLLTYEEQRELLNIAREALSNCVRHANASSATLSIESHGTRVRLVITDNGTGFDAIHRHKDGYGLNNMASRAKKLGGQLRVHSQRHVGTQVLVEFTLDQLVPH